MQRTTEASYLGAILAYFGGLNLNEWASVIGIVLGVMTYCVSHYYKHKEYKILKEKLFEIEKKQHEK